MPVLRFAVRYFRRGGVVKINPGSFNRALTLAERAGIGWHADSGHGKPASAAARRLCHWRDRPPFADQEWWNSRLSAAGITESQLLALLSETDDTLAWRFPEPEWAAELADTMSATASAAGASEPDITREPTLAFAVFVRPCLEAARTRLTARLRNMTAACDVAPFDPGQLAGQLHEALSAALTGMVIRTLVLELNLARASGALSGSTGGERFADFTRSLRQPGRRLELLARYPVLARQLALEPRSWLSGCERFAAHLIADQDRIEAVFNAGRRAGTVTAVKPGLGDRHRGGATVMLVRWSSGLQLVYKPRPASVDVHFQDLVAWLNDAGFTHPLRTARCLDAGDHGWMEFVQARPCLDEAARHRFYYRQGGLLALLYLVQANDIHAENLIADGEHPVLVDLETLVQPGLPADTSTVTPADTAAGEAVRGSVLTVGLLPERIWGGRDGTPVDLSGLGFTPGQRTPMRVPTLREAGQDTMRVELAYQPMALPQHRPVGDDALLSLLDYTSDVLAGFTQAYQACAERAADLAAGPLAAFDGDEVRVVLRATMWYDTILRTSFHPDLLRDALDRERHFDALWRDVPDWPSLAGCVEYERADLWRNDIPVFTTRTDSAALTASDHQPVDGFTLVTGMQRLRERLAELGEADLARQRWLMAGALGTSALDTSDDLSVLLSDSARRRARTTGPPGHPAERGQLVGAADAIGRHLAQISFQRADSAQWIGINSLRGKSWSFGPLQADLYHGLTGVALFLCHLGMMTGDVRYTRLARDGLRTVLARLQHGTLDRLGGMAGTGGVIYALCEMALVWQDESLIDAADALATRAGIQPGPQAEADFTGGAAGTIAGLLALYPHRPSGRLRDQIRAHGDWLLETAIRTPDGIGWVSAPLREIGRVDRPIAGFGHGGAGVIGPLFRSAELLGDDRYRLAADDALACEQAMYDANTGTWDAGRASGQADELAYWCHGAVGIGLSRLSCLGYIQCNQTCQLEIASALTTLESQPSGTHCLCHGDAGNLELYLQAAQVLAEPRWELAAATLAGRMLTDFDGAGWMCGNALAVQTPGLMTGLAGIGYGLLRVAEPAQVPAILLLRPTTT